MQKIMTVAVLAVASLGLSAQAISGGIPQSFPANSQALEHRSSKAAERMPAFPPSKAMGQPAMKGTPNVQGFEMPDSSLQGTSRIPAGPGLDGFNNRGSRRP